eukprot:3696807-Lingulodinium_polyedra.AAC.1
MISPPFFSSTTRLPDAERCDTAMRGRSISATCHVIPHLWPSSVMKTTSICPKLGIRELSGPRYRLPLFDIELGFN